MTILVEVVPLDGEGFRVVAGPPINSSFVGSTREEAIQHLRDEVEKRIRGGSEFVSVGIQEPENPWLKVLGVYKDDPLFDEWQQAIAEYRKQIDEDPDAR
jgi:hypothetical protein